MRVTLDTNCLIYLERASCAPALQSLVGRFRSGSIQLCIPAISASERSVAGNYLDNYSAFTERLRQLDLDKAEVLLPMAYFGVCFWGHCLYSGAEMVELEKQLHSILHPHIEFSYAEFCAKRSIDPQDNPLNPKWRNAKCDVQIIWSHIWHKGDVLVTNDRNFIKRSKLPGLLALGAGSIIRPDETNTIGSIA